MNVRKLRMVVVADAHPLERLGILAVLKRTFSFERLDLASDISELESLLSEAPELAILDKDLPGLTTLEMLRQLKLKHPAVKFVLVSTNCSPKMVFDGLMAGALGIIEKTVGTMEMVEAFRMVAAGHVYMPSHFCDGRSSELETGDQVPSRIKQLSTRQRQVLELACEGISNKEIARKLDISEATVKVHVGAAFRTMGVTNRTHAAAVFRENCARGRTQSVDGGDASAGPLFRHPSIAGNGIKTLN